MCIFDSTEGRAVIRKASVFVPISAYELWELRFNTGEDKQLATLMGRIEDARPLACNVTHTLEIVQARISRLKQCHGNERESRGQSEHRRTSADKTQAQAQAT